MSRDTASVIKPSSRTFPAPVEAAARRRNRSSFVSFWSLFRRMESLRDEAAGARFLTGAAATLALLASAQGGGMAWAARACGPVLRCEASGGAMLRSPPEPALPLVRVRRGRA